VTTLTDAPETVYQLYCQRGDMENRLKELHDGLALDRTRCSRFLANQCRVLLTLLAVWVERSVRRIVLHLPTTFPWLRAWRQLARAVGATA